VRRQASSVEWLWKLSGVVGGSMITVCIVMD